MNNVQLRLGTRGSQLALWQSNWVKARLEAHGHAVELVIIKTEGDLQPGSLVNIGGQGLFTKRLQIALLENEVDFAVHSLKDLPTEVHDNLAVTSVPEREDSRDVLLSTRFESLNDLPPQATIGTGSVRRAAQLKHLRPDLNILDIRGNVDTRLAKLEAGDHDAIILARAGLKRLEMLKHVRDVFNKDRLMPAVGQGALGLESRANDETTRQILQTVCHQESFASVMAEREMLRRLQGGCLAPIGAWSTSSGESLTLEGTVLAKDGSEKISSIQTGSLADPVSLGQSVASDLLAQGASRFLES